MESDLSKEDREKRFRTATMLAMATAIPIFLAAMNGEIKTKEDFKNVCGKVGDALEKMFLKTDKHVQDMNIAELKQLIGELVVQEKYEKCAEIKQLIEFKTKNDDNKGV